MKCHFFIARLKLNMKLTISGNISSVPLYHGYLCSMTAAAENFGVKNISIVISV